MSEGQKESIVGEEDIKLNKVKRMDDVFDSIVRSERFLIEKIRDNLPYVFYEEETNKDIADFMNWVKSMREFLVVEDELKLNAVIKDIEADLGAECENAKESVKEYKRRNKELREQVGVSEVRESSMTQEHVEQEVAVRENSNRKMYGSVKDIIKRTSKQIKKELMLNDRLGLVISIMICVLITLLAIESGEIMSKKTNLWTLNVLMGKTKTSESLISKFVEVLMFVIVFVFFKTSINEYLIRMCFD